MRRARKGCLSPPVWGLSMPNGGHGKANAQLRSPGSPGTKGRSDQPYPPGTPILQDALSSPSSGAAAG